MKTVDEIIGNWESESLNQWYAVDEYKNGCAIRIYVGDRDRAKKMATDFVAGINLVDCDGNPCEPGEFGNSTFYRFQLIGADEALTYFKACSDGIDHPFWLNDGWFTIADAASFAGVSRQRIQKLIDSGKVYSEPFGGMKMVSVESLKKWVETPRKSGRPKKATK